jgi:hypothetical protein
VLLAVAGEPPVLRELLGDGVVFSIAATWERV